MQLNTHTSHMIWKGQRSFLNKVLATLSRLPVTDIEHGLNISPGQTFWVLVSCIFLKELNKQFFKKIAWPCNLLGNIFSNFWHKMLYSNLFFQLGIYFLMSSSNDVTQKTFLDDFFQCQNLVVIRPCSNSANLCNRQLLYRYFAKSCGLLYKNGV